MIHRRKKMKLIDKLVADGVIKEENKEDTIISDCPSNYGYIDNHISGDLEKCKECWNREVEE